MVEKALEGLREKQKEEEKRAEEAARLAEIEREKEREAREKAEKEHQEREKGTYSLIKLFYCKPSKKLANIVVVSRKVKRRTCFSVTD